MAIEWVAISAAVLPHIQKFATDRAEKLATNYGQEALAGIYRRIVPNQKLVKANEAFVARFSKELDSSIDLPTLNAEAYQQALQLFLCNPTVQDLLQAPLDAQSQLDWEALRGIWKEFGAGRGEPLIELPADFDWAKVAKTYRSAIQHLMLVDPELRPVIQAVASIRNAEANERTAVAVERLVGPIRAFDLTRYAADLKAAFGYLKMGSLDSDWTHYESRVRLESVYVPQGVKEALPPLDLTRDYLRRLQKEGRVQGVAEEESQLQHQKEEYARLSVQPLMEVVDHPDHMRLVILGDPGLGKSTLLIHLGLRWAENPSLPLTLMVELRRACAPEKHGSNRVGFLDYLEKGAGPTCGLPRSELHEHLKNQGGLVLFNGLDEVTEACRSDAVADIIQFAGDYPKARIIVTTRICGYNPGSTHPEEFRNAGFQQFTLQDFDDREIDKFIRLWHQEAFSQVEERNRYEARLRNAIADSPAIRELAANPLLLTMMAILGRNRDLPRDRTELYESCAKLLLKNWDLEKFPELKEGKDKRDIKDKLGPAQKMRILEQVAAAMQHQRTGLAGNLIAEEALKKIVETELALLDVHQPWTVAENLIGMLRERNFMLANMGDQQFAFVHRTFLEYFCARDLQRRLEKTSSLTLDALLQLIRERWRQDEWHEVVRLLCGLIGAEYAAQCVSELLSQGDQGGGHGAVILAAQCLREIRELGQIREVRGRAREALLRLARGWKDEPDTLPLLKDSAANAAPPYAREGAVEELIRGWKDDPETLVLAKRLVGDFNEYVGMRAVYLLVRGWRDDPGTLPFLKAHATDGHPKICRTAMEELVRHWKDDDTVPWLKECADGSRGYRVREMAIEKLAYGWKDDPSVQEFVAGLRNAELARLSKFGSVVP